MQCKSCAWVCICVCACPSLHARVWLLSWRVTRVSVPVTCRVTVLCGSYEAMLNDKQRKEEEAQRQWEAANADLVRANVRLSLTGVARRL